MSTTRERWGGKFRVVRHETVGGSVFFYAERRDLFWLWDAVRFGDPGTGRFRFDTQQEVESKIDELVTNIAQEKADKRGRRTKSVKVVAR